MVLARRTKVMGKLVVKGWLYWLGWVSTAAMTFCIIAMGIGFFI
jgi:hypothetical protein